MEHNKHETLDKMAQSTYGTTVYKAKHKLTGKLVILKKPRLETEGGIPPSTLTEIGILKALPKSMYIVDLISIEYMQHDGKPLMYLVFEYHDTDLKKVIDYYCNGHDPLPVPDSRVRRFMFQLSKGVAHCHERGVVHRDLKPENLLVDEENGVLKIAGFGLAKMVFYHQMELEHSQWDLHLHLYNYTKTHPSFLIK